MSEDKIKIVQRKNQPVFDFLETCCTKTTLGGQPFYYCPFGFVDNGDDFLVVINPVDFPPNIIELVKENLNPMSETKMKKKIKNIEPEFPKVFETFQKVGHWEFGRLLNEPSCFNGEVRVERYRITVEKIEEDLDVVCGRLEKLWVENDNHHNYQPLWNKAKFLNYTFKGEFGSKKPKK